MRTTSAASAASASAASAAGRNGRPERPAQIGCQAGAAYTALIALHEIAVDTSDDERAYEHLLHLELEAEGARNGRPQRPAQIGCSQ